MKFEENGEQARHLVFTAIMLFKLIVHLYAVGTLGIPRYFDHRERAKPHRFESGVSKGCKLCGLHSPARN